MFIALNSNSPPLEKTKDLVMPLAAFKGRNARLAFLFGLKHIIGHSQPVVVPAQGGIQLGSARMTGLSKVV